MSIEEKKVPLEFTFIPSNSSGPSEIMGFDITYEPDIMKRGSAPWHELTIKNNGREISCPVELFTEVVDFLTKKGIIKAKAPVGPTPRTPQKHKLTIPLPVIDGVEERIDGEAPIVAPFTSFDNSREEDVEEEIEQITPAEDETPDEVSSVKVGGEEVSSNIVSRPVIRSRVGNSDDPLAAEKEAAMLRGEAKANFKRVE